LLVIKGKNKGKFGKLFVKELL